MHTATVHVLISSQPAKKKKKNNKHTLRKNVYYTQNILIFYDTFYMAHSSTVIHKLYFRHKENGFGHKFWLRC